MTTHHSEILQTPCAEGGPWYRGKMNVVVAICMVFIGCCSNVVFLEVLIKSHPGSGNIITFCQFLFIALEGFIFTTKFGTETRRIPLSKYVVMVAIFFMVQVVNNQALNYNISMPLHMIFRAGSLMANLVLGVIILRRKYSLTKYLSVAMITTGIAVCTIVSSGTMPKHDESSESADREYTRWLIGIGMLCFALFVSARMGIFQEQVYKQFGKHTRESLFYNHMFPLPMFYLLFDDILKHVTLFNQSEPFTVPVLNVTVPIMWLFLVGNVVTQYVCITGVFTLTTECTSLTVTLVVTLRKFVSLLFSIFYFQNPFTVYHWLGTVLVFGGTLIFTETLTRIKDAFGALTRKRHRE